MLNTRKVKRRRICVIDVDSIIPNLALMKTSTYFKNKGLKVSIKKLNYSCYKQHRHDKIVINAWRYDKVFVSTIFTINKGLVEVRNCDEVYYGGTGDDGASNQNNLPIEIEHMYPDYSIYPENEYSLGYLTRGCIRNCKFCFIPKKEGKLKLHSPLKEFYNEDLPKIMLLDNNFLAHPDCIRLLKELKETGKKVTFKQGLDFRLLNEEKAKLLSQLNYDNEFIFAFDRIIDKPIIERNLINIWKPLVYSWNTKFFVLVGYDSTLKEDLERIYFLRKHKCLAYVMRHDKCYSSPYYHFYVDLAAWCNQPFLFKNMSFKEFIKKRHVTKERYNKTMKIIKENNLKIK